MPLTLHTAFEAAGYAIGFRLFLWLRKRRPTAALADLDDALWIVVGAMLGAASGSKIAYWLNQPDVAFAGFPSLSHLMAGKSIVGGLVGGWLGVEYVKWLRGVTASSGDVMVWPLTVGIVVGRIGCFLSGLDDQTHGLPTTLPWSHDYGDGIPRHPVQIYEIAYLLIAATLIECIVFKKGASALSRGIPATAGIPEGSAFKLFLGGYLLFRLLVDFLKPVEYSWPGGTAGLQWLCAAGLLYFGPHMLRITWGLRAAPVQPARPASKPATP